MTASAFGVYQEGGSFLHRLDPRCKIGCSLCFLVAAFLAKGFSGIALVAMFTFMALAASSSTPRQIAASLKPFGGLIAFVFVFDVFFVSGGEELLRMGPVSIDSSGVAFAFDAIARFVCVLLATSTLMRTTSPQALTDGFSLLFSPLKRFGIRTDDFALSIGIAFRFISVFHEELERIKRAQQSRGACFSAREQSLAKTVRAWIPAITALFSSAFRRSNTLALALANREYGIRNNRTSFDVYRWNTKDTGALLLTTTLLTAATLTWLF